ncbi:coatomer beta [Phyllosticta citricarpa]|uniref:Coatomer subunit beta' n=1 Tax=Phyllosticta paracitricarpa TaxID=2016321 RepID=A0ABR1MZL1_9PEZI
MRLDVKRQLFARSERVKGIDFHPTEPWVLTTLYSGHCHIWSYETQAIIKTFELCDVPVRAGRFIARKNWIVCGSDDFQLRVYNYNTSEKITSFEAHPDYIRAICVHPNQPFVLTASDDMTIKLWDWERGWKCVQVFEGHAHYVMGLAINPKDTNTFASACLDRTVKIWSLGSPQPRFTLEAHETKGVNHVDYYPQSDKPYLLTTSDDRTVKVWDYTTKALIATLEGHTSNVSFAVYHPELPVIISGSEDGTVKIWHANTYRLEQSLNYGLERAWCVSYQRGKQGVAVGFDDGAVVVKMGREEPAVSMDANGKIIWAKHSEILSAVIKGVENLNDGEYLTLPAKDLGSTEIYPQTLTHSPNGRFVAVCGDGEYIIYTALALRNQAFGSALDFAWASKENDKDYAIRESATSVKIFRNFKVKSNGSLNVGYQADGLSGGTLLGVKGQGGIGFFDWESGQLVRRIEVEPKNVYWSENGELVTLACDDTYYVLRFSREDYVTALQAGEVDEDGVEAAFEVITDVNESVRTGQWVGDCFVYTNSTNRLNYLVGDQVYTISHFDTPVYVLGYLPRDGRVYICNKDVGVMSYALSLSVIEYQTLVLRGELEAAMEMLVDIPAEQKSKIARFLEGQGYKEEALDVATDDEHRFDLSLSLGKLDIALELARKADVEHKWKTVGDTALAAWQMRLAEECFTHAKDLGSLLLLYSSTNNAAGLRQLASLAEQQSAHNVAFSCLWQVGDVDACIDLLVKTSRVPEAVLFAQTYKPSRCPGLVKRWKAVLERDGKSKVARLLGQPPGLVPASINVENAPDALDASSLAAVAAKEAAAAAKVELVDEAGDADMFPEWDEWLRLEREGGSVKLVDVESEEEEEAPQEAIREAEEVVALAEEQVDGNGDAGGAAAEEEEDEADADEANGATGEEEGKDD